MYEVCIDNQTSLDTNILIHNLSDKLGDCDVIESETIESGITESDRMYTKNQYLLLEVDNLREVRRLYTPILSSDKSYLFAFDLNITNDDHPLFITGDNKHKKRGVLVLKHNYMDGRIISDQDDSNVLVHVDESLVHVNMWLDDGHLEFSSADGSDYDNMTDVMIRRIKNLPDAHEYRLNYPDTIWKSVFSWFLIGLVPILIVVSLLSKSR